MELQDFKSELKQTFQEVLTDVKDAFAVEAKPEADLQHRSNVRAESRPWDRIEAVRGSKPKSKIGSTILSNRQQHLKCGGSDGTSITEPTTGWKSELKA